MPDRYRYDAEEICEFTDSGDDREGVAYVATHRTAYSIIDTRRGCERPLALADTPDDAQRIVEALNFMHRAEGYVR